MTVFPEPTIGTGARGTSPYGDLSEHVPYTEPPSAPIIYPEFHPTDARAVEIYLDPNHFNLFPNPSFRVNTNNWVLRLTSSLTAQSWVGRGLFITGPGRMTSTKIYVGPTFRRSDVWQTIRNEFAFSLFSKGTDARIQLSLFGYRPKGSGDEGGIFDPPTPEDTPSAQIHSPSYLVNDDDWERRALKTTSRMSDISSGTSDFSGCWWVEAEVKVMRVDDYAPSNPKLILSSFMLDTSEGPLADYFDGDMNEGGLRDDFLWFDDGYGKYSVYYYERLERTRWLYHHLYNAVPVNRPVHIYYMNRNHPWPPDGPPPFELTSDLRTTDIDGPSLVEMAVRQYGSDLSSLP